MYNILFLLRKNVIEIYIQNIQINMIEDIFNHHTMTISIQKLKDMYIIKNSVVLK